MERKKKTLIISNYWQISLIIQAISTRLLLFQWVVQNNCDKGEGLQTSY